ncbi:nodulation protein NfeD [Bacillus sp. HMF5848]|uniref:nodulation protein NfeD n=1 Tax=Bacillus sp. HMF5848 TaxID=2495421 RepID=UPI0026A2F4CD
MKNVNKFIAFALLFSAFFMFIMNLTSLSITNAKNEEVYVIPLEETVEKGLYAFIDRSLDEAEEAGASMIILEVNTPGGAVDAASDIGKRLSAVKLPLVAFVNTEALSAGAYISLHAEQIFMTPGATMGAAAVIDQQGNAADKKAQSYWNAAMKSAAELHGRDPKYALAMADESIDLPEFGAGEGELLTLTAEQALQVNYANGIVKDRNELLQLLGYEDATIVETKVSFAENIARLLTNPFVIPILLSIASLGLIVELYSPGFGIPGLMGITALLLFFYGHLVAGLAGMESIILFIIGIILLFAELFVPGGILGLIGAVAVIASIFVASDNVTHMAVSLLVAIGLAILGSIIMFRVFGKRIQLFRRLILADSTNTESGYVSNTNRLDLIGLTGTAMTDLRPSGMALIHNERLDVVSEGQFIRQHDIIKIVKVEGSRIVVRKFDNDDKEENE